MPRPFRSRRVRCAPVSDYFKPRGVPVSLLDEVNLTMDELESMRLADLEGKYHEDAAKDMEISRQTFGNILNSAHKKVADSLLNGKAVKIEGGEVNTGKRQFICNDCGKEWPCACGEARPERCPSCGGKKIHRADRKECMTGQRGCGQNRNVRRRI